MPVLCGIVELNRAPIKTTDRDEALVKADYSSYPQSLSEYTCLRLQKQIHTVS
jgi:hypothetical protein